MSRKRRNHSAAFKARVALAALKGDKTIAELVQQFDLYPNQITQWKAKLKEHVADFPERGTTIKIARPMTEVDGAKIGNSHQRLGRSTRPPAGDVRELAMALS